MKILSIIACLLFCVACNDPSPSSDEIQRQQQEKILQEGTAQIGMPAIKNFRERKILKDIIELRDQTGLSTYTYIWSDFKSDYVFFCNSIGYGIPYATQFTNPEKIEHVYSGGTRIAITLPQADPGGLFSPGSAEGTWVMCKNPNGKDVSPVYIEPRIIVSTFELKNSHSTESTDIKVNTVEIKKTK